MKANNQILFSIVAISMLMVFCINQSLAKDLSHMVTHGNLRTDLLDFSDRDRWDELRKSDEYEQQSKLVNEILFLNDQPKVFASLNWLRDIVRNGEETDYIYPYMYAIQLHRAKYLSTNNTQARVTARAMSYYSKLLLMTDAARCDDNGVGVNRFYNLSKTLSKVNKETDDMPDFIKERAMDIALFLEDKYKHRSKQSSICQTGAGFMARAMQSENTKQVESVAKEGNKYGYTPDSKMIAVLPDEEIEINYISDEEWHKKRKQIREKFDKSLKK